MSYCKNGHDLSGPDSRATNGNCKICKKITDTKWKKTHKRSDVLGLWKWGTCKVGHDLTLPNSKSSNGRCRICKRKDKKKWNNTPEGRYYTMKRDLRYRMSLKKQKISELEELLNAEEITD